MKRFLALLLMIVTVLSVLVSCNAKPQPEQSVTENTTLPQTQPSEPGEEITPTAKKITAVSILTNDDTVEFTAALELLKHLEAKGVSWSHNGFPIELSIDPSLGDDAYRIEGAADVKGDQTTKEYLHIIGGNGRGVIYGVVRFLEDFAGVRFFTPELETHSSDPVMLPESILVEYSPVFEYRRTSWDCILSDSFFFVKSGMNGDNRGVTAEMGGGLYYPSGRAVHTLGYFTDTEYAYPLYAPNPCLALDSPSGQQNLEKVIAHVREILYNDPTLDIVSVSQTDRVERCGCSYCAATDEEEGSPAGTLLRFVNAVAENIAEDYPNVTVSTLAYKYSRKAPQITKPRENVCIRLCSIECHFNHPLTTVDCETCSAFREDIEDWSEICDNLYIWDYTTNFRYYLSFFPNLYVIRDNMRFYADHNVKGMFCQGNSQGLSGEFGELRAYLLAKLIMYPYMTEEEYSNHINEFLEAYYGAGWQNIRAYIDALSEIALTGAGHTIYDAPFTSIDKDTYCALEPTIFAWWQAALDAAGDRREYVERSFLHVRHAQLMHSPNVELALQLVEDVHKLGIAWREGYRYVDIEKTDFSRGPGVWVYK